MRIALAQTRILWENKKENLEKARRLIREEAQIGSELMLFPEMSFTGFSMNTAVTREENRQTVEQLSELAQRHSIAVGFGWVRGAGEKCENCYTVVGSNGELLSEFVKIHPFSYSGENQWFAGGEEVCRYQIGGIGFSTFICYDLRFPEEFREVAEDVSVILVPASWPASRREHWEVLLRARAIENQVYILGINCFGDTGGQYYSGGSCVIRPDGRVEGMLSDQEGILRYELNDDVERFRDEFPVFADRKCEKWRKTYDDRTGEAGASA